MRTLSVNQSAIVASKTKEIRWLFDVYLAGSSTPDYYWAYEATTFNGQSYTFRVTDHTPINMQMVEPYLDTIPDTRTTIECSFKDSIIDGNYASDFENGIVIVRLVGSTNSVAETELCSWKFKIESAQALGQVLTLECLDFFTYYLDGDYPNTATVTELFPNKIMKSDNIVVPITYGTVFIPLRWNIKHTTATYVDADTFTVVGDQQALFYVGAYLTANCGVDGYQPCWVTSRSFGGGVTTVNLTAASGTLTANLVQVDTDHYLLGPAGTYNIAEARSSKEFSRKSTYLAASYTFTQFQVVGSDTNSYEMTQCIAIDANKDGTNDSNAYWGNIDQEIYDAPFKFSNAASVAITNPMDIIVDTLEGFGIPSADIDATSAATIAATFTGRSFTWNVGLFYAQDRKKLIAKLFTLAGVIPIIRDKIYFKLLTKTSQMTLTEASVQPDSIHIDTQSSFSTKQKDSGYVTWQYGTEPVDRVNRSLMPCKATTNNKSNDTIEAEYIPSEGNAKKAAKLALQRKLLKDKNVSFTAFSSILALEVGDIITINDLNLGSEAATYDMLITKFTINDGLWIDVEGNTYSDTLDDWGDIAVVISGPEDVQSTNSYSSVYQGQVDASGSNGPAVSATILVGIDGRLQTNIDPPTNGGLQATNYSLTCYNTSGDLRFQAVYNGTDQGDCTIGDYANSKGIKYDQSAGTFTMKMGAGQLVIDGTSLTGYNAGAQIRFQAVYAGADAGDLTIGNYAGGVGCKWDEGLGTFDIKGTLTATSGAIGGFTIGATTLSSGTNIVLDSSNKAISINSATYGNSGIQLQYNGGTPRFYVGDGSTKYMKWTGTALEMSVGTIKEFEIEVYTSGVIRTMANPAATGGLLATKDALICYSDTPSEVFKVILTGGDRGDVIIGNFTGNKGCKWDQSAGTFSVRGSLNADDLLAGTITARTFQTASSGQRMVLDASTNQAEFYGSNGTVVEQLCTIGITNDGSDNNVLIAGSYTATNNVVAVKALSYANMGVNAISHGDYAVYATSHGAYGGAFVSDVAGGWAGVYGGNNQSTSYGVRGSSTNGCGVYGVSASNIGGKFEGYNAAIVLVAGDATVPNWTAPLGSLWVTSAGKLYINTNGSTTWALVGSQT